MVIRLGQTAEPRPWFYGYRIHQGQTLQLRYISDAVATLRAWARVIYDDGTEQLLTVPDEVISSDRVEADAPRGEVVTADGWVVGAEVEMPTASIQRGRTYVKLQLEPFGTVLCADYCYSEFGQVALGTHVQPGPGGGSGHLRWVTIKADSVPATFNYTLALSNTIRSLQSLVWYYVAGVGVATRTLKVRYPSRGGALPTGMSALSDSSDVWVSSLLTLTASQHGTIFADPARSGINDNVTIAIDDTGSAPSPFPVLIPEDTGGTLRFVLTDVDAGDFDAVYGLFEDWVVL